MKEGLNAFFRQSEKKSPEAKDPLSGRTTVRALIFCYYLAAALLIGVGLSLLRPIGRSYAERRECFAPQCRALQLTPRRVSETAF